MPPMTREHRMAEEYEFAAKWCAQRKIAGRLGDPLPELLSSETADRIAADVEHFMSRVRAYRYARAMSVLILEGE